MVFYLFEQLAFDKKILAEMATLQTVLVKRCSWGGVLFAQIYRMKRITQEMYLKKDFYRQKCWLQFGLHLLTPTPMLPLTEVW